ncbi:MAG: apolipoprotein N-acyltransferase, partial [Phycisphaerae bacterium]
MQSPRAKSDRTDSDIGIAGGDPGSRGLVRLVDPLGMIERRRTILLLAAVSLALCCLIFPDIGWWPLSYFCLVPWLICVCTTAKARFLYFVSYLLGLGYFLINIRWMCPVTPPGYFALCAMDALSFPLAAWPIRHLYRRRGFSVALAAPFAWVAFEYLRSIGPTGFPWLLLGHSQYRVPVVIQISDLVGAYGVSFVLMMVNGWITDLLIQPILVGRRDGSTRLPLGSVTTLTAMASVLIYGGAQLSRDYLEDGPRIAMIQHDIPMYVNPRPGQRLGSHTVFEAHLELARRAAAEKPDLIVLPETIVSCYMNREFLEADRGALQEIVRRRWPGEAVSGLEAAQAFGKQVRDAFQQLSNETGIPIVVGSSSLEWRPADLPPRVAAYNSAFLIKPGEQQPVARYDKRHLVLFGEYVPFRYSYNSIYEWLNSLTPWGAKGGHYSLTPGND